jgi:DNA polymerase-3 subunit gamma/tau
LIAATSDQRPAIEKAAARFSEEDLTRFFQILLQTDDDLRRKPGPRVHLEMGLLRLINASRLAPLEELLADLKSGANSGTARAGASAAPQVRQMSSSGMAPAFAIPPKNAATTLAGAPAVNAKVETKQQFLSSPAAAASSVGGDAAAPKRDLAIRVSGISQEQVLEIKTSIQAQQKFLGELVEHGSFWELEGAELRIYFSPANRTFAELIEGRDTLEKIRVVSSKVLGRAVRVCAKLESVAAAAASASGTQELRAQFERDPVVRSMLQRFGGKISEVRPRQEEK